MGKAKSAVYECLVPFDDKSMETRIRVYATIIIRPHHSTTYIDAAYCYQLSSVACHSVCHLVSPAKMAEATELPFASRSSKTQVGPGKHLV